MTSTPGQIKAGAGMRQSTLAIEGCTVTRTFATNRPQWAFLHRGLGLLLGLNTLLTGATVQANTLPTSAVAAHYGRLPMAFEVNQGQTAAPVKFLARGSGYNLFLTPNEAVLTLHKDTGHSGRAEKPGTPLRTQHSALRTQHPTVLRLKLVGANPRPGVSGQDKLAGVSNYFIGNDKSKWHTSVAQYARVKYASVYRGIDLIYYGQQRQLEYDFVVAPGADASVIRLGFGGAQRLHLTRQGELVIETGSGRVVQHAPVIYQIINGQRRRIAGRYALRTAPRSTRAALQVGFHLGAYDHRRPLVIDPQLLYSTFLGGSGDDAGHEIAIDNAGNAYVTGNTLSSDFPTLNAAQSNNNGLSDAFVTKLNTNSSGTPSLVYSTYLGGSDSDVGFGIALDNENSAYVTGSTSSSDFPTAAPGGGSPYSTSLRGSSDAFVTKLNASGNILLYSTYLGGSNNDDGYGIKVQGNNVYVVGRTFGSNSTNDDDFPTTGNAYQQTYGGGATDAFVSKLNPAGAGTADLVYSTYLGGINYDEGRGIALDATGAVYVAGNTNSDGTAPDKFPTTTNAYNTTFNGPLYDVFVSKLNTNLAGTASLVYSTYLGGTRDDEVTGDGSASSQCIAVDSSGTVYVIGFTSSSDFPTTPGAYDRSYNTNQDAFISKLNPAGAGTADLVYSTYLGGSDADYGLGIAVDGAGMIYATGSTYSNPFPTTNGAYQTTHGADGGGLDAFISKLNPVGGGTADLVYSTYLGGSNDEGASGISVDSGGAIYVVGTTSSPDFPTTPNAYQTTSTNISDPNNPFPLNDAFVSKLLPPTATAVKLISFTATRYTGVLWLNWQTGYEVDNLGFNVYREVKGKRVRLNRTGLIAGSALQGAGSGETYAWPDALQAPGTKYWLEDVDTRGKSTWHGPITPRVSTRSAAAQRRSPLLGAMAVSP